MTGRRDRGLPGSLDLCATDVSIGGGYDLAMIPVAVSIPIPISIFPWNGVIIEQAGKIGAVDCVAKKRSGVEDFLHGAQVRGMGEVDLTCKGEAMHVPVSVRRDDNLAHGVVEIIRIVIDGILLGFIKPDDDGAVVFVGP